MGAAASGSVGEVTDLAQLSLRLALPIAGVIHTGRARSVLETRSPAITVRPLLRRKVSALRARDVIVLARVRKAS